MNHQFITEMGERRGMKALELWCRRITDGYTGVKVENMTTSWRDGLAFCALIHHFRPDLIDFELLDKRDVYKNNELAFRTAERHLGIPALLDAEDMVEYEVPDRLSILTYLSQYYQIFGTQQANTPSPSPVRTHTSSVTQMISPSATSTASKVGPGRLERCCTCKRPVFLAQRLVVGGRLRHRTCFACARCGHQLNVGDCYETEAGDFVCETCPDEVTPAQPPPQPPPPTDVEVPPPRQDPYSLDFETVVERPRDAKKHDFMRTLLDDMETDGGELEVKKEIADIINSIIDDAMTRVSDGEEKNENNAKLSDDIVNSSVDLVEESSANNENSVIVDDNIAEESTNVGSDNPFGSENDEDEEKFKEEVTEEKADVTEEKGGLVEDAEDVKEEKEGFVEDVKEVEDIKEAENKVVDVKETENKEKNVAEDVRSDVKEVVPEEAKEYPEDLNPFGDEDAEESPITVVVTRPPVPATRMKHQPKLNKDGKKIIEAPASLNPFWSDGEEPSSDEEGPSKPTPAPRTSLKTPADPRFGSSTSLSSMGSILSSTRRKKGPAPLPPALQSPVSSASSTSTPSGYGSRSPVATLRSRKSRPAPPPPPVKKLDFTEKYEKNYENKLKQNLSGPVLDKSEQGKWKRKKGLAPGLPVPQRRRIPAGPMVDVARELDDLEVQQAELERQGVNVEQAIRKYEFELEEQQQQEEDVEARGDGEAPPTEDPAKEKEVEGLVLQLFDIVNQKNELFRKQAELMQLRRAQRLEEEHADLEYQIRCLMGRPERNKTDSDKAQEEELIARLVKVVERRNHIVESLDMDRKREVEEDESIQKQLERLSSKGVIKVEDSEEGHNESTSSKNSSKKILKFGRKKKLKKDKQEKITRIRRDADKDIDESAKSEEEAKVEKKKKKWFS